MSDFDELKKGTIKKIIINTEEPKEESMKEVLKEMLVDFMSNAFFDKQLKYNDAIKAYALWDDSIFQSSIDFEIYMKRIDKIITEIAEERARYLYNSMRSRTSRGGHKWKQLS